MSFTPHMDIDSTDSNGSGPVTAHVFESYVDVLRHRAAVQPARLALHEFPDLKEVTRSFNYSQMDVRCRAIAAHLQALNAQGERALLAFDNDADYLLGFLACAYAGVIAVPLFAPTQRKHVERFATVAADCEARILLTSLKAEALSPKLGLTRQAFPGLQWVICNEIDDRLCAQWTPIAPSPDEIAYLQYTSGSTGLPRGVIVTHANLMYQGRYVERSAQVRSTEKILSWLPLYHDMGLIVGALQSVFSGATLWLSTPTAAIMHPRRWLKAIGDLGITHSGAPNFFYDMCTDSVDVDSLQGVDLSSWSVAFNAAEPVRANSIERFVEKFGQLGLRPTTPHPAYGLAEATLVVTMKVRDTKPVVRYVDAQMLSQNFIVDSCASRPARALVAVGSPSLETVVRIVDPATGSPCEEDCIGAVLVAGPTVAKGYWQKAEVTREIFQARIGREPGAFLQTGDLGFLDANNNLYITGRAKDLIVITGRNHYPQDIEETVEKIGADIRYRGVVALGVERDKGEVLILLVELERHGDTARDLTAIAQKIRSEVAAIHDLPVAEIAFLASGQLPMTTSGKIQRRASLEMLEGGRFQILGRIAA